MELQPLTPRQAELLREGIELFNRREFFACHEVLEAAWLVAAGEQKLFLQGLIQVAVAFHHLQQRNFVGARRLLQAGMEKLSQCSAQQEVLDIHSLLAALDPLPERIGAGEVPPDWPVPSIRLRLSPSGSSG